MLYHIKRQLLYHLKIQLLSPLKQYLLEAAGEPSITTTTTLSLPASTQMDSTAAKIAYQNAYDAAMARHTIPADDFSAGGAAKTTPFFSGIVLPALLFAAILSALVFAFRAAAPWRNREYRLDRRDDRILWWSRTSSRLSDYRESIKQWLEYYRIKLEYNTTVDKIKLARQWFWHTRDDIITASFKIAPLLLLVWIAYVLLGPSFSATITPPQVPTRYHQPTASVVRDGAGRHPPPVTTSLADSIPAPPPTVTVTVVAPPTSIPEADPATETDYWAPHKGRTYIGHEMVWCRECQQSHAIELPY